VSEREQGGGPPALLLGALEPFRAAGEFASLLPSAPILATAPRGDGQHVLVLPGFMATDASTVPLRRFLDARGFRTSGWALGRNLGFAAVGHQLRDLLARANDRAGGPVSLLGWSLGGLMARRLAGHAPKAVTRLVTLGSPLGGTPTRTTVWRVYDRADPEPGREPETRYSEADLRRPPEGVPCSAIYSRTDGIVPWRIAREAPGPLTENIEVRASHIGLGVNPGVFYAVADRLAQPPSPWQRFRAPLLLRPVIDHGRPADE
jgi:pimeloyl-ACP methyl ester carboxylesterase